MEKIRTDGWEGTVIDGMNEVEKDAYVEILVERPETIEQYSDQMSDLVYELVDLRSGLLAVELNLQRMRADQLGVVKAFFRVTDDRETHKRIRKNRGMLLFCPQKRLQPKASIERISFTESNRVNVLPPFK